LSFVEKLSNAVSESVKTISDKSSNMVEISKMNLSIRKREKEIESLLIEIGEYVYNQMKSKNTVTSDELRVLVKRIDFLQQDVETLEKMVFKLQDMRVCEYCKEVFEDNVAYCPLCGKYIRS